MNTNACSTFLMITLLIPLIISALVFVDAEIMDYPSFVDSPKSWWIPPSSDYNLRESFGVKPIFVNWTLVCGFHCSYDGDNCLFAISIFSTSYDGHIRSSSQVVWSANRGYPVQSQAQLQLFHDGQFRLTDTYNVLFGMQTSLICQKGKFRNFSVAASAKFIQLGSDGHLKAYEWKDSKWEGTDLLPIDPHSYPFACENYGICLKNGCSCPIDASENGTTYFKPINYAKPDLGHYAVSPIFYESSIYQSFLEL
ncbi:hypothetical protein GOBAR_DD37023 [Gossypium barbadense]|nr:hypothetical protein GOBAR_DD37023 [Gossypium barbadense]